MTAGSGQPSQEQAHTRPDENTVNAPLTPKPRRRLTENSEYAAFARRVVQAYGRRVSTGDVEALAQMILLAEDIDAAIRQVVSGCPFRGGW
jgi:hypothetical protein